MIAYCIVPTWKKIVLVVTFDPCCPSYVSIFSVWLSARWAMHSPDNHQRIILYVHVLCLVKICALYICWKTKLLLIKEMNIQWDWFLTAVKEINIQWDRILIAVKEINIQWDWFLTAVKEINIQWDWILTTVKEINIQWDWILTAVKEINIQWDWFLTAVKEINIQRDSVYVRILSCSSCRSSCGIDDNFMIWKKECQKPRQTAYCILFLYNH